jgi:multidrug efflux pump subunit AcrA (membrane-fusion protein)
MLKWISIVLAVCGAAVGVYAVATNKTPEPEVPLARAPSVNPFAVGVASLGIVEPAEREVGVLAPEPGLVTQVHAQVGDRVLRGDVLFELDSRVLEAERLRAEARVASADAEVARWRAIPRAEDLPPLRATVARAEAVLADRMEQLRVTEEASRRGGAVSRDVDQARFAVDAARADRDRAQAELDRAMAGGWGPDLVVLEASRASAQAEVDAIKVLLDRLKVRAPRDAMVLRRSIEAGEYASLDPGTPPIILGDLTRLHVRAQVDEEDIALLLPNAGPALGASVAAGATTGGGGINGLARTRGSVVRDIPLRLVRIEPFARPKVDITGTNAERVDTRVIDVVFEVVPPVPGALFPGQAVDVFIDVGARVGARAGAGEGSLTGTP